MAEKYFGLDIDDANGERFKRNMYAAQMKIKLQIIGLNSKQERGKEKDPEKLKKDQNTAKHLETKYLKDQLESFNKQINHQYKKLEEILNKNSTSQNLLDFPENKDLQEKRSNLQKTITEINTYLKSISEKGLENPEFQLGLTKENPTEVFKTFGKLSKLQQEFIYNIKQFEKSFDEKTQELKRNEEQEKAIKLKEARQIQKEEQQMRDADSAYDSDDEDELEFEMPSRLGTIAESETESSFEFESKEDFEHKYEREYSSELESNSTADSQSELEDKYKSESESEPEAEDEFEAEFIPSPPEEDENLDPDREIFVPESSDEFEQKAETEVKEEIEVKEKAEPEHKQETEKEQAAVFTPVELETKKEAAAVFIPLEVHPTTKNSVEELEHEVQDLETYIQSLNKQAGGPTAGWLYRSDQVEKINIAKKAQEYMKELSTYLEQSSEINKSKPNAEDNKPELPQMSKIRYDYFANKLNDLIEKNKKAHGSKTILGVNLRTEGRLDKILKDTKKVLDQFQPGAPKLKPDKPR